MAHMIDETTGKAAMAYRGDKPWHGLGQTLTEDADIGTWTKEAGLNWEAQRANLFFSTDMGGQDQNVRQYPFFQALYRSDTKAALGIVSDRYREVQPADIMGFFRELTNNAGFQMETAGALSGGKRIWALAKVNDGANILGNDRVAPYLLLATSYDGTMATTAKFTTVRVVCNNTITMALKDSKGSVRVTHANSFEPLKVSKQLGLVHSLWDTFLLEARVLANKEISEDTAIEITRELFTMKDEDEDSRKRAHSGYENVMRLFKGAAIGSKLTEGPTAWQWLNSVTEWVDWKRGHNPSSRINSAWFGEGSTLKEKAMKIAMDV